MSDCECACPSMLNCPQVPLTLLEKLSECQKDCFELPGLVKHIMRGVAYDRGESPKKPGGCEEDCSKRFENEGAGAGCPGPDPAPCLKWTVALRATPVY